MKRSVLMLGAAIIAMAGAALAASPAVGPWGVELGYIDKSVKPGDDFFQYANGLWIKKDVIPADRTYSGVNLELDLSNEARLKGLVSDLANTPDDKLTPEGARCATSTTHSWTPPRSKPTASSRRKPISRPSRATRRWPRWRPRSATRRSGWTGRSASTSASTTRTPTSIRSTSTSRAWACRTATIISRPTRKSSRRRRRTRPISPRC